MFTVECIDCGREACGFSGKSRESEMTSTTVHELGKRHAGITRRLLPIEDHIGACWFESLYPSAERCGWIEIGRPAELAKKCYRKAFRSRVVKGGAAVGERLAGVRQRHEAGTGDIFLLHVDQNQTRGDRSIGQSPEIYDLVHAAAPSAEGRLTPRALDRSRIPASCQLPSGRMITEGSVSNDIVVEARLVSQTISI